MVNINYHEVLEYIQYFNIEKYFSYCIRSNSSLGNSYHNMNHTLQMIYHLAKAANYYHFTKNEGRLLVIAGLFHDVNHSGGKLKDSENVKNAIIALDNAIMEGDFSRQSEIDTIKSYIQATEYPYVIEDKDLNLGQKIIRDSDLLVSLSSDFFPQVCCGLYHEASLFFNIFLMNEEEFLKKAFSNLRTDYAIEVLAENLVDFHKHFSLIKKLFNENI